MVPLTSVPSEFAGRVLVAKLGSAGILAELRGVSRVYPSLLGEPHVWVEADELADARELITADLDDAYEIDRVFAAEADAAEGPRNPPRWVRSALAAVALILLVSFGYGARSCGAQTPPASSHSH